jgi:hypothetical protein
LYFPACNVWSENVRRKNARTGTCTADAPGENRLRRTRSGDVPAGEPQDFEFEHGKLPYLDHGKPESILDVALNFGLIWTTPAAATAPAPRATSG